MAEFSSTNYDTDPMTSSSYDPFYTADISNKMQVPSKIAMDGDDVQRPTDMSRYSIGESQANMQVPERILLAGHDQHIGVQDRERNLHLDLVPDAPASHYVGLSTPPRVLKIEDMNFSQADEEEFDRSMERTLNISAANGVITMSDSKRSITPPLPFTPGMTAGDALVGQGDSEMALIQRHIARLHRHITHLERENYWRSQREKVLYPTVIAYFLFQLGRWFFSRN